MPDRSVDRDQARRVRVWDLPTRLFHWVLVPLLGFSWWAIENDHLDWHKLSGSAILALVIFRVYWGFAGSATARFAVFLRGPGSVMAYAAQLFRLPGAVSFGHNPMGGWSVLILLTLLLTQTALGLFAVDVDGLDPGPLGYLVSFDTGRAITRWHGRVFNLLLAVSALHVVAIAFYRIVGRENLVWPMIVGSRTVPTGIRVPALGFAPLWKALPGLALAIAIVGWILFGHF